MAKESVTSLYLELERKKLIFSPGEYINGKCVVELDQDMVLNLLEINLRGMAKVEWEQEVDQVSLDYENNNNHDDATYSAKHELMNFSYFPVSSKKIDKKTFIKMIIFE